MNIEKLKAIISNCVNDIVFTFNDEKCGITSQVSNYIPIYECWYGNNVKEFTDVDKLISDTFFEGKSLKEIINQIEITIL